MKIQKSNYENLSQIFGFALSICTLTIAFHLFYSRFFIRQEFLNKVAFEKYLRQISTWEKVLDGYLTYKVMKIGECELYWLGKNGVKHKYIVKFEGEAIFANLHLCYESKLLEKKIQKHLDRLMA